MEDFRYLAGVSTLRLDRDACVGCGMCEQVCPHGVLRLENGEAAILDFDGCMECGACAKNCPAHAIRVSPGVGCAAYIIQTWIQKIRPAVASKTRCC
jgi:NAD-dependent dihydropyrimidine dehydrogenase PreA subunit